MKLSLMEKKKNSSSSNYSLLFFIFFKSLVEEFLTLLLNNQDPIENSIVHIQHAWYIFHKKFKKKKKRKKKEEIALYINNLKGQFFNWLVYQIWTRQVFIPVYLEATSFSNRSSSTWNFVLETIYSSSHLPLEQRLQLLCGI